VGSANQLSDDLHFLSRSWKASTVAVNLQLQRQDYSTRKHICYSSILCLEAPPPLCLTWCAMQVCRVRAERKSLRISRANRFSETHVATPEFSMEHTKCLHGAKLHLQPTRFTMHIPVATDVRCTRRCFFRTGQRSQTHSRQCYFVQVKSFAFVVEHAAFL
jgi:hypothetical protein